jgi:hypothetical protein
MPFSCIVAFVGLSSVGEGLGGQVRDMSHGDLHLTTAECAYLLFQQTRSRPTFLINLHSDTLQGHRAEVVKPVHFQYDLSQYCGILEGDA